MDELYATESEEQRVQFGVIRMIILHRNKKKKFMEITVWILDKLLATTADPAL